MGQRWGIGRGQIDAGKGIVLRSITNILSLFLALIHLSRSTQTCANKIAHTGPNRSSRAARPYPRQKNKCPLSWWHGYIGREIFN